MRTQPNTSARVEAQVRAATLKNQPKGSNRLILNSTYAAAALAFRHVDRGTVDRMCTYAHESLVQSTANVWMHQTTYCTAGHNCKFSSACTDIFEDQAHDMMMM